jgi:hypothetical protein
MTMPQKNIHDADESKVETILTSESSSTASPLAKHKLRFSLESNQVFFPIVHINDVNLKDLQKTWYTKAEFDNIKQDMISDIRKMISGEEFAESTTQTARGLAYRNRQVALRQQNKIMARETVLDEQMRQLLNGEQDNELVASAYLRVSIHCQAEAYKVGSEDEAAIKKELEEMRRTHRIRSIDVSKMNFRGPNGLLMQARQLPFQKFEPEEMRHTNRIRNTGDLKMNFRSPNGLLMQARKSPFLVSTCSKAA